MQETPAEQAPPPLEKPKANKYLKSENRWTKPLAPPKQHHGDSSTEHEVSMTSEEPSSMLTSTTVKSFVAAQMHHAEPVTIRQDSTSSTSSSSSSSEDESERRTEQPQHMVLQSATEPMKVPIGRKIEIQVEKDRREEELATRSRYHPKPVPQPAAAPPKREEPPREERRSRPEHRQEQQQHQQPRKKKTSTRSTSSDESGSRKRNNKGSSSSDAADGGRRTFNDPAYANFQEMSAFQDPPKKKTSGFFSSLFKKRDRSKGSRSGDRQPRQFLTDSKTEDSSSSSSSSSSDEGDGDDRTLKDEQQRVPVVPMPGTPKQEQPLPPVPRESELRPPSQSLERKRSASRPTDLDEAMRRHEQRQKMHDGWDQPLYQVKPLQFFSKKTKIV